MEVEFILLASIDVTCEVMSLIRCTEMQAFRDTLLVGNLHEISRKLRSLATTHSLRKNRYWWVIWQPQCCDMALGSRVRALSPFMMGVFPKIFFLFTQLAQFVGSPPEFCQTEIAVPTRNGALSLGADEIAIWAAFLLGGLISAAY